MLLGLCVASWGVLPLITTTVDASRVQYLKKKMPTDGSTTRLALRFDGEVDATAVVMRYIEIAEVGEVFAQVTVRVISKQVCRVLCCADDVLCKEWKVRSPVPSGWADCLEIVPTTVVPSPTALSNTQAVAVFQGDKCVKGDLSTAVPVEEYVVFEKALSRKDATWKLAFRLDPPAYLQKQGT